MKIKLALHFSIGATSRKANDFSGVERFGRCRKMKSLVARSKAGESFYSSCPNGYAVRSIAFSQGTTKTGETDTIFSITYKKVVVQKQVRSRFLLEVPACTTALQCDAIVHCSIACIAAPQCTILHCTVLHVASQNEEHSD